MKSYLLFLVLFFGVFSLEEGFGQCPTDPILSFTSQAEVDAFLVEYPGCTEYGGSVNMNNPSGSDIVNLQGLQNLTSIGGDFRLWYNDALISLSGLENLTSIGGYFWIRGNDALSSLSSLQNLTSIGGDFRLWYNDALISLSGLENLTSIGGDFYLWDNAALISLSGLENLTSIGGYFHIESNDALTSLSGLENLTSIGGYFYVGDNAALISLSGLENLTSIGGDFRLRYNAALSSLSGLENLTSIGGEFRLWYNDALISLSGLENLTSIGGDFNLRDNAALISLSGLENLTSIGGEFYLRDNDALINLSGLENLTSIGGDFYLWENDALINLSGLENLTSIGGDFSLRYNAALINLSGSENLTSIGGEFYLRDNDALINLSGLENLTSIGGDFSLWENAALSSLSGLENLTSIGGYFYLGDNAALSSLSGLENLTSIGRYFRIWDNDALISLSGLENLTSIGGDFGIAYNTALTSLSGLENLTSIGGNLTIINNPILSLCNSPFICDYLVNGNGTANIYNNASGCNSENEILFQCGDIGSISLHYFYDENQNATQDNNEPYLPMMSALISPGDYTVFGNQNAAAIKYLYYGDYTVSINESPLWNLTNGNTSYNISLDSINNSDTLYFGFIPNTLITNLSTTCVNTQPRCNQFVTFEPLAINNGTTIANGTLWFDIDAAILDVNFIDPPDTLDGDNRVGWYFTELYPGHTFKRGISLQLPGPPDFPIGDLLNFGIQTYFEDENGFHSTEGNTHRVEVQCSYDPNDKLVQANNPYNYSLTGEDLIYTIRFQNTGNAEAYDVVIKDLLSEDLDLSTFQFIASSHESVLSTYLNDRMLTFEFRDIFLPDSTTNFDASQGYVLYSIRALDTLADFSTIENTANIFFDYNPAVVTNTTENVMVESFDVDGDGFVFWEDCDDENGFVNPSVVEIPYNGIDDDCNNSTPDDDLDGDGVLFADDCDDNDPLVTGISAEIPYNGIDDDCDATTPDDDLDGDGVPLIGDCDDTNPMINYNMPEIPYNGLDDDCNPSTPDDDLDGDGYNLAWDCNDYDPLINMDAIEIPYNGVDDDCNPLTPDDDLDNDGFSSSVDCDDNPATGGTVNPAAVEIPYNGIDDDCNELTLDDDLDQDGFVLADDCDDGNADINPNAIEIPNNNIDEDCNGEDLLTKTKDLLAIQPQIYPNPTSGVLHIRFPQLVQGTCELRDLTGQLILEKRLEQKMQLDLSELPGGVYILLAKAGEGLWTERVIKL